MGLSRSAIYFALWSCLAHGAALGLVAALVVSPYHGHTQMVKIFSLGQFIIIAIGDNFLSEDFRHPIASIVEDPLQRA